MPAAKKTTAKDKLELTFTKERETKNTVKFREDNDSDNRDIVGSIYILNSAYEALGEPDMVTVTIEA